MAAVHIASLMGCEESGRLDALRILFGGSPGWLMVGLVSGWLMVVKATVARGYTNNKSVQKQMSQSRTLKQAAWFCFPIVFGMFTTGGCHDFGEQ